ncbi:MAG: carbon storage regulator [Pirellulales bacterium]|nr:carbon storage regulator [Pirellulales bacterium]
MLVLSRRRGEAIRIGDHITLTVVRLEGQRVRLSVEAPAEVRIVRAELLKRCQPAPR